MSFNLKNLKYVVNNAKRKINLKKRDFNTFIQEQREQGKPISTIDIPDSIKSNPYFWIFLVRSKFSEKFKFIFFRTQKLLSEEKLKENINPMIKISPTKMVNFTKNASLVLINVCKEMINMIIQKGFVPLINKNNYLYLIKIMGQGLNTMNKKFSFFMNRYKDPNMYKEMQNKLKNYEKKIHEHNKKYTENKTGSFSNPFRFLQYKDLGKLNMEKLNNFINAPVYRQKLYKYETKLKNIWKNRNSFNSSYFTNIFDKIKQTDLSKIRNVSKDSVNNLKEGVKGGIKKKIRKILFYIAGVLSAYYLLKYGLYRLTARSSMHDQEETLNLIKDIKKQNEEIIKVNKDLLQKLQNERKR